MDPTEKRLLFGEWTQLFPLEGEETPGGWLPLFVIEVDDPKAGIAAGRQLVTSVRREGVELTAQEPKKTGSLDPSVDLMWVVPIVFAVTREEVRAGGTQLFLGLMKALRRATGQLSTAELTEYAAFGFVAEWMDARYGEGEWTVDIYETRFKPVANAVVFDLVEKRTSIGHRLLVDTRTYQVKELSVDPNDRSE